MQPEDRDLAHLWDMLQAARDAVGIVANVTHERFLGDRVRMLALERSHDKLYTTAVKDIPNLIKELEGLQPGKPDS